MGTDGWGGADATASAPPAVAPTDVEEGRAAQRRRVSRGSRVLGALAILAALVGAVIPAATAFAVYRGLPVAGFLSPSSGLAAAAAAGAGVVLAAAGAVVGRRATSALVIVGGLLGVGVLIGLAVAFIVPAQS